MITIAKIFSIFFSPPGWVMIYIIIAYHKGIFGKQPLIPLLTTLFVFVIPIITIYLLYRRKKITHLDIVKREERIIPLTVSNLALWILLYILHLHRLTSLTNQLYLFAIILIVITLITLVYKVSLHMAFTVYFSSIIIWLLNEKIYNLLYLTIPLIFWSRLALKRHTIGQLVLAFLVSLTIIALSHIK